MQEITHFTYKSFLATHDHVLIEKVKVALPHPHKIKKLAPDDFKRQTTTVWSFLDAGFVLREDVIKMQHNMKSGKRDLVWQELQLPPDCARTPFCIQEAQRRREGDEIQAQREMVVSTLLNFNYFTIQLDIQSV